MKPKDSRENVFFWLLYKPCAKKCGFSNKVLTLSVDSTICTSPTAGKTLVLISVKIYPSLLLHTSQSQWMIGSVLRLLILVWVNFLVEVYKRQTPIFHVSIFGPKAWPNKEFQPWPTCFNVFCLTYILFQQNKTEGDGFVWGTQF